MRKIAVVFILFVSTYCYSQQVQVINTGWIDAMKANTSDTLYIINFWATWCKPCVEELPYFEKIGEEYKNNKVKVLLVSTDMRKDLNTRVNDFVTNKKLKQSVLFMNEINAGKWIDKVSVNWSGAIPATWFIKGVAGINLLKEGELAEEELRKQVTLFLEKN